jgi:hypothetical protein
VDTDSILPLGGRTRGCLGAMRSWKDAFDHLSSSVLFGTEVEPREVGGPAGRAGMDLSRAWLSWSRALI